MNERSRAAVPAAGLAAILLAAWAGAHPKNFEPDVVFDGSSLEGWHTLGGAVWEAADGLIVGRPEPGGWLVLDRALQDVALVATFRCEPGCETGILLRAEETPDGGLKGVFVSIATDDRGAYRVTLDRAGVETSREPLRHPGGGQLRVAPPPDPETAGPRPGGGGGFPSRPTMPGGGPEPVEPPAVELRAGEWHTVEVVLDANILRAYLDNTRGAFRDGVAEDAYGRFGPVALYAGGTGEVRFRQVAYKDLQPRAMGPEVVSPHFRKQALNPFYYSWGPAVADIDRDGVPDVVAGPYYYLGPDYTEAREIYLAETLNPSTQYFNGLQYAHDFTGDGWPDVLTARHNQPVVLYVNPRGESRRWDAYTVTGRMTGELALLEDIDGDGTPDLLFKDEHNRIVYATPDPRDPTGLWVTHAVSESGPWPNHGLGVGDLTGDGRMEVLSAYGWWARGPEDGDAAWTYHPAAFGDWDRSSPGGAQMAVYDVNGNGLNDVVTSLQAHGWGLAWFEQTRDADGTIAFARHAIMGDFSTDNAGGVTFSQLHGSTFADIDGDGIPDFITGKRFWSHLDNFIDPDPHGLPVLYVYRTVRDAGAPGGAAFVPELVHNRSGVGSHVAVADLNGNGALDIVTTTRRGTFIFWNEW